MNIQAMMRQAQKLQKEMSDTKNEIDNKTYEVTKSFVTIKMKGNNVLEEVKINMVSLEKEDIEMLEDLLLVAINEANSQIAQELEEKMGKYTKGIPGLF